MVIILVATWHHQTTNIMKNTVITEIADMHLSNMLDEIEGSFDYDPTHHSQQFLEEHYVPAALYLKKKYDRPSRIDAIQDYFSSKYSLPFDV